MAGDNELGPRDEKYDMVGTTFPMLVSEEDNLTIGKLQMTK